jgi:hypothetical protein
MELGMFEFKSAICGPVANVLGAAPHNHLMTKGFVEKD